MKHIPFALLLLVSGICSGQDLDLIVTDTHDSIACRIDSVSQELIFFTAKMDGSPLQTLIPLEKVSDYRYASIYSDKISRIRGTIYFHTRQETLYRPNNLYASVGFFFIVASLTVNYERLIAQNPGGFFNSFWIRAGGGLMVAWEFTGTVLTTTVNTMTGKKNHHLEMGAGISYAWDYYDEILAPAGGLGYRFQKPEGGFIFRTGLSYPETFYLSLGVSF